MPYATTQDGTKLRWKALGQGRPVILIHGWPLSADSWDPIMIKLAEAGYRAIEEDATTLLVACPREDDAKKVLSLLASA